MRRFLPSMVLSLAALAPTTQASASTPPAAPVLVQSAATSSTATFTWTAPSSPAPITRFELRRNGTLIAANLSSSLTSYTFNSLTPDSTSTVLLRACSSFGCSPDSAPLTLGTAPAAPSSRIDVAAPTSIKSSWLSPATTHVWYKTAAATTWVEWTPGVPDTNPTTITGLTNGVAYVVRVEARNAYGSTFTPVSSSQTPRDLPNKPVLTFARATTSSVTLSWTAPATNGSSITSYAFFRDGTQVATTGSVGSYTFTGLTPGSSYAFTVQACNAIGCSVESDTFTASPLPSASTSVSVLPRDGSMDLSWTAATGATAYKVFYRPSASTTWIEWTPGSPDTSPTSITGLLNGTPYAFAVAAVNSSGSSTLTTASGTPRGAPGAPVLSLTSPPTATSAPLTWTLPAANGSTITSFKVYRNATLISTTSGRTLTSSGLPAGSAQSYYVEACNAAGCTASNTLNVQLPPAAPSASATRSNQSITLSWSTPTGSTAVAAVWYKLSTATTWIEWTPGTAETSPATITGLTNGTAYHAKVVLTTSAGSAESSTLTAIPVGPPSQAPAAPTFPFMSASTVGLAWPTPVDTGGLPLSSFRIYRNGTLLTTTSGSARSFTATALASGSWHSFQIEACNSAGCSPISLDRLAATFALPPTSLAASSQSGSLVLSWTNSTGNAVSGYAVQYTESTTTPWIQLDAFAASSPATVTNLTGRMYFVRVCAVDQAGNRCTGTVQVVRVAQDYTPPPPRSLVASPLNGSVSLAWLAPVSSPGSAITDYVIEYRLSSSTTWTTAVDGASTTTSATVSGLTNGSSYQFRVSAINAAGTGAPSTTIVSTPRTTPSAPGAVSFTKVEAKSIELAWDAPTSDGGASISGYRLYRDGSLLASLPASPRTYLDDSVKPGTLYSYQVEALNIAGPSPITGASTTPTLPDAPTLDQLIAGPGLIQVYWTSPAPQVIDSIVIFVRAAGGSKGNGEPLWAAAASGSTLTSPTEISGLTNGKTYEVKVSAVNTAGSVDSFSLLATPLTPPSEPRLLVATPGDAQVGLSWSPPLDNGGAEVSDYEIEFSNNSGASWSTFEDGKSPNPTATVTNLANGVAFVFRVRACNESGCGIDSNYATTAPVAPGGPGSSYAVGDVGPGGGIVFYVNPSGFSCGPTLDETCTYLEAAPAQWSAEAPFDIDTYDPQRPWINLVLPNQIGPSAQYSSFGSGFANSLAIIAADPSTDTAAYVARSYTGGGKSDWYLPAQGELLEMLRMNPVVTPGLSELNGYWSSTEWSSLPGYGALGAYMNFDSGGFGKGNTFKVRPVRAG